MVYQCPIYKVPQLQWALLFLLKINHRVYRQYVIVQPHFVTQQGLTLTKIIENYVNSTLAD
jgi:hypothetical protein